MPDEDKEKSKGEKRRDYGSIFQRGDVYYARWTERGRYRVKAVGLTKTLAERFLARKRAELDQAAALGIRPVQSVLFENLLNEYPRLFAGQKTQVSILRDQAQIRAMALKHFRGMRVEDIHQEDVERFLTKYVDDGNLTGATKNRMQSLLSGLFRRAVRVNYMRVNPCQGIPRAREELKDVPYLTVEDQQKLASCLNGALRNAALLAMDTGIRLGELLRLDWQDINFAEGILTVRISKNKTPRTVPFGARGREALLSQRGLRGGHSTTVPDIVFETLSYDTNRTGEPDFPGFVRKAWNEGRAKAGFPTLRWHDLRHVFAVTAIRAGVPLGELRQLLGHKSLVMVLRYARHSPSGFERQARERMEKFLRGEGRVEESVEAVGA